MKRWTLRICVSLLLGAIVNVAVAWGVALWSEYDRGQPQLLINGEALRAYSDWFDFDAPFQEVVEEATYFRGTWYGPAMVQVNGRASRSYWMRCKEVYDVAVVLQTGWPVRSLSGELRKSINSRVPDAYVDALQAPSRPPPDDLDERFFPLRPIWPGFAINTVFYAAILWGLFAAPFALRRWRRRKRGLCPACGYDLRGSSSASDVCPECGKALDSRLSLESCEVDR